VILIISIKHTSWVDLDIACCSEEEMGQVRAVTIFVCNLGPVLDEVEVVFNNSSYFSANTVHNSRVPQIAAGIKDCNFDELFLFFYV
jgi:hypothetical protein